MDTDTKQQLFLKLSLYLAGEDNLTRETGDAYLDRLTSRFGDQVITETLEVFESILDAGTDINPLVKSQIMESERMGVFAKQIIMLWYTGQFTHDGEVYGSNAEHYFKGLLWKVIYAHPPGSPGGGYGYWASPPEIEQ